MESKEAGGRGWNRRSGGRDAGTQRWKRRKKGQKKANEKSGGGGKSGARRRGRVEDERRGNEKERLELLPSPPHTLPLSLSLSLSLLSLPPALFSEALIFNDILGCTEVPLMHGHYNMVFSLPLPPLTLSLSLSIRYKGRVHACTSRVILPRRLLFPSASVSSSFFHPFSTHHRGELTSHRKSRAVSCKCEICIIH